MLMGTVMSDGLVTLSVEEVLSIRQRLAHTTAAQRAFGPQTPLYPERLESAVARQRAGFGGHVEYDTQPLVCAALFHGLCLAHAFENGNKRTALVSTLVLCEKSDLLLVDTSEDDLYDLATRTAEHRLPIEERAKEVRHIAQWLQERVRDRRRGQERVRFSELRTLLEERGCEFDPPRKNFIKIRRQTDEGELTVRTGFPNARFEVPPGELRRIRQRLHLDERSGYDAAAFFDLEASVDGFVNDYRQLMNRLADI
jgi:prophage maintenance system killer protein